MTLPDDLVKAVAKALIDAGYVVNIHAPTPFLDICVAAVLRALPESEDVRRAIIRKLTPCFAQPLGPDDLACLLLEGHAGDHSFPFPRAVYADAALATIAKLADEEAS